MRACAAAVAFLLVAGCTGAGGDKGPPIGRAARDRHGADPVAVPPADVGNAEDPRQP